MKELMTKHEHIVHQKMQAEQHLQDYAQRNEVDQKRLQELKRHVVPFSLTKSIKLVLAR